MADEHLLLSGAKTGVLVEEKRLSPLQIAGGIIGVALVLVGAVDVVSRVFALGGIPPRPEVGEEGAGTPPPQTQEQNASAVMVIDTPTRLRIPALGVDAPVEMVGVNARGAMATPSLFTNVAWFKEGAKPGALGNAVFAGHLNNAAGIAGVFERLHQLEIGDEVLVVGSDGSAARFAVRSLTIYDEASAPREQIFLGDKETSRIVLITCNGAWDHEVRSYEKRLVVVAERL